MITIFTPTYNREKYLEDLYQSLKNQTCKDFEWLVVDDGSTDNTPAVLQRMQNETTGFDVRIIRQKNGGKHRAINRGVLEARGEFFFIVDSDDKLKWYAIEKVVQWCKEIDMEHDAEKFAGVSGLMENGKGIVGGKGNGSFIDVTNLQRRKNNLTGDKAVVYRTDILKKYPYREFEGETFLTEETVFNVIAADGYKIRWYSEIIYECEYRQGGLSDSLNELNIKNFQGYTYQIVLAIKLKDWYGRKKAIGDYMRVAKKKGYHLQDVAQTLNVSKYEVIFADILVKIYRLLGMERGVDVVPGK